MSDTAPAWQRCFVGSCHRHQDCMYRPCRAPQPAPERGTAEYALYCLARFNEGVTVIRDSLRMPPLPGE